MINDDKESSILIEHLTAQIDAMTKRLDELIKQVNDQQLDYVERDFNMVNEIKDKISEMNKAVSSIQGKMAMYSAGIGFICSALITIAFRLLTSFLFPAGGK